MYTKAPFSIFRSLFCAAFTAGIITAAPAQPVTTESLTVESIAPQSAPWLAELATTDDYKEPGSSEPLDTQPLANARATARPQPGLIRPVPTGYQPKGALSDKVIFTMAGHGWTYDSDRMFYYTQRGLSHGMVEDIGNADQMHIFAHLLFNSGATVVPLKPIDHQPNERIIDNSMPQATFYGNWRAGSSDRYFGPEDASIKYAVAPASLEETALARYRPWIPETGYYPVYVWARDGADRSNQLYRVWHSGGTTEVRVDWRKIGKAWIWLGTYHFEEGDGGFVDITNQVIDPYEAYGDNVVVADAVRFGNGKGDVPRPGGISGFDREDEGDNYWLKRSLGTNADRRLYDAGRDGNSTISSPPKAAAHINRESHGSFLDRLLISFHSNASTGKARGTVSLFNASAHQRPSYQESLAEITGAELNAQMRHEREPAGEKWTDRQRNTYSGINFGELRRDYIQNEMVATIVETAFHDNPEDVTFLVDPRSRINMAQATLRGMLAWESDIKGANSADAMPPARPTGIAATINDGRINVKWLLGEVGRFAGGPPVEVRVYRSSNGYGFDGGTAFPSTEATARVDLLTTSGVTFLRVTAINNAGESLPSQTIAVRPAYPTTGRTRTTPVSANTLLLAANTVLDRTTNIPYALGTQPGGGPYRATALTERVRAIYALMEPSGAAEALAMAANNQGFDGADTAGWQAGLLEKDDYRRILITTEQQEPTTPLFTAEFLNRLRGFIAGGGKLYISGSGFAANLADSGRANAQFLSQILGITEVTTAQAGVQATSPDSRFMPTTSTVTIRQQSRPWATQKTITPAEFELQPGRSLGLLQFTTGNESKFAAALTRPTPSEGEVFVIGFPLSLVEGEATRNAIMAAILKQM